MTFRTLVATLATACGSGVDTNPTAPSDAALVDGPGMTSRDAPPDIATVPDGPATSVQCTAAASLCGTLSVPNTYAGTPKKIIIGLYETLPPLGPPDGVAAVIEHPVIGVSQSYGYKAERVMPAGDWLIYIALYDVTGGEFEPVAGIDYTAATTTKLRVGDGAVNLPAMTLAPYQP